MRLWKKISIFLIYPLLMLAAGFLASIKLQDFFYPSREQPQIIQEETAAQEQGSLEAAELGGLIITCDTRFVVKSWIWRIPAGRRRNFRFRNSISAWIGRRFCQQWTATRRRRL